MSQTFDLEAKASCVTHAPHTIRRRRRKSDSSTLSKRLSFPNIIFRINTQSFPHRDESSLASDSTCQSWTFLKGHHCFLIVFQLIMDWEAQNKRSHAHFPSCLKLGASSRTLSMDTS